MTDQCQILKGIIPDRKIQDVLRLINKEFHRGCRTDEIKSYIQNACWFPFLRQDPLLLRIEESFPARLRTGTLCEPQIVLAFPNLGPTPEITFHVDEPPPWANGRQYARIVGVPLTRSYQHDGCLIVKHTPNSRYSSLIEMNPGDIAVLRPDIPHSPGVNMSGMIRYAVYFRYLEEPHLFNMPRVTA